MIKIIEGIVKIVHPGGKAIIGIADGEGQFTWLPTENIIKSFPSSPYQTWQTTRFMVADNYEIKWKPEKDWEQWKHTYNADNIKPLPSQVPAEFAIEPELSLSAATNIPSSSGTATFTRGDNLQPKKISPVVLSPGERLFQFESSILSELRLINNNIYKIRQLFEKYMKEPEYITADNLIGEEREVLSEDEVRETYGETPKEIDEEEDYLPDIFDDF